MAERDLQDLRQPLIDLITRLSALGGDEMDWPWRKETDPFWKAVAEILLIRTTRKAAARAYLRLKQVFPSSREVAIAKEEEIRGLIKEVGLPKRAKAIKTLAEKVSSGEDIYRGLSQRLS